MRIPSRISPVRKTAERAVEKSPVDDPKKNMVIIEIKVGNLPLQGTKLLVRMAMSLSRSESMIRQPITPAALHPKPMHMGDGWENAVNTGIDTLFAP